MHTMSEPTPPNSASPVLTGLGATCPRCGKAPLFRKGLVLRERCTHCGLDYAFVDSGDGPAIFAIFILGALVLGGALIAEFMFGVPVWMHVLLWGVATPLAALFLLRWLKATLIALQFHNKAEEGRHSGR
jgi:uncharacterized protein (DUF983 family)